MLVNRIFALTVFLMLVAFPARGASDVNPGETRIKSLVIDIGQASALGGLPALATAFAEQTGTSVQLLGHDGDLPVSGSQRADIICRSHDLIASMKGLRMLQAPQASQRVQTENVDLAWERMHFDGQLWAYPIAVYTPVLIYNRQLLPNAPSSMEVFARGGGERESAIPPGIDWDYTDATLSWAFFAGAGSFPYGRREDGSLDLTYTGFSPRHEGAVTAMKWLKNQVDTGVLPRQPDPLKARQSFLTGQTAATIAMPWFIAKVRRTGMDVGISPIPGTDRFASTAPVWFWGCAISADADLTLATDFLESHLLRNDTLERLFLDGTLFGVPSNKAAFKRTYGDGDARILLDAMTRGMPVRHDPRALGFWQVVSTAIERATSGRVSTEQALKLAEKALVGQ